MNIYILIGIGLGLLILLIFRKSLFRNEKSFDSENFEDINAYMNNEKLKMAVNEFISQGKKIEAIKYVRETCNTSLSDSKELIDKMELMLRSGSEKFHKDGEAEMKEIIVESDTLLDNKVKTLLLSGNKILAIKLVAEDHKKGLAEAKNYVDNFENKIHG
ncbi:MAG: hypothetical protein KBF96_05040 [Ignavibacteria bacterium]|nr:hypothetical protein [Ignavibacteria bacterium]